MDSKNTKKPGVVAYISLTLALVFFSGLLTNRGILSFFDFSTLGGTFGSIATDAGKVTFVGSGGDGAKSAFLNALNLTPPIIFALAMVATFEYFGALDAARASLTPLLRPLLGIPGICTLAMVASWQSTDGGGVMTKTLYDGGDITEDEMTVFLQYQFSGGAPLINYFGTVGAMWALTSADGGQAILVPLILPFVILMVMKFFGAALMRLYLSRVGKKKNQAIQ